MTIKPIKTERDYQEALKEIEKLWDAKPDTAKGDRLDVLVTLVEAYEQNTTTPMQKSASWFPQPMLRVVAQNFFDPSHHLQSAFFQCLEP